MVYPFLSVVEGAGLIPRLPPCKTIHDIIITKIWLHREVKIISALNEKRKFSEGLFDDETVLECLKIQPGQTIVDAGCGNGYMAKKFSILAGNTGKVYALDPDREAIDRLKRETENTNIEALVDDITTTTEIRERSVDLVYLSTVFHIFSDAQIAGFEREVRRILKPEGRLAVLNIKKENTPFGPPLHMRCSPEEVRQKLSLAPAEYVEIGEYFYMQIFLKQ
jgi:SAM-dependent methyltransferase